MDEFKAEITRSQSDGKSIEVGFREKLN